MYDVIDIPVKYLSTCLPRRPLLNSFNLIPADMSCIASIISLNRRILLTSKFHA